MYFYFLNLKNDHIRNKIDSILNMYIRGNCLSSAKFM
jgi:hypothetical protein